MKTIRNPLATSRAQHLALACACIMMVSVGWAAKIAVDRISAIHDEMENDLKFPSQEFLRHIARLKTNNVVTAAAAAQVKGSNPAKATAETALP